MKKILCTLLVLSLMASLAGLALAAEVAYPLAGEMKTVSWWHPLRAASYQSTHSDNIVWQQYAKDIGVNIEWIHPATGSETEQLTLLIASNKLPDVVQIDGLYETAGGSAAGVDDGIFVDLTDHLVDWAPDYLAALTSSELCYAVGTTADGRVTEFAQIKQTAPQFSRETLRVDIQAEIGWGDTMPVTIEDYTKLFADMKAAGYYGWAPAATGLQTHFIFQYGITNGFCLGEDGKVIYGMYAEGFKDYLKQMAAWYAAGYIHPDFTGTITRPALFDNKEVGLLINPSDIAYSNAKLAGYGIYIVNYPRLYEGQRMRFETTTWDAIPADNIRTVVSANCKELETAIKMLNYGYTEQGARLFNWGIEGTTYTVGVNGTKAYTDTILNNPTIPVSDGQYIFKLHFGPKLAEPDILCNPGTIGDPYALELRILHSDDKTVDSTGIIFAKLTVEQAVARAEYMTDIDTYMKEMTLKFILGELDVDANWDAYMATMKAMGIEEAIAITQEAVDIFNEKQIPTEWIAATLN